MVEPQEFHSETELFHKYFIYKMKLQKNLSITSSYSIGGDLAAYFSAQVQSNGDFTTNKGINNQDVYRNNRDEINNAYALFEDEVFKIVDKVKEEGLCE